MIQLYDSGIYLVNGEICKNAEIAAAKAGHPVDRVQAEQGTMAYGILKAHNVSSNMDNLQLKVDSMTSHDIT